MRSSPTPTCRHFPSSMLEPLRTLGAPVDLRVGTVVVPPSHAKEGWTL
jgi:hypothetical protein